MKLIVAGSESGCASFTGTDGVIKLIEQNDENGYAFSKVSNRNRYFEGFFLLFSILCKK